jgi:acetolactate synthase-1/2/3 large subunit
VPVPVNFEGGVRMKYSDLLADWLVELGYTHCFFLAGGNIMHLLESCSRKFTCIPVVHEVAAGIAVEYFNEVAGGPRAFAMVTAGPGLTNIVTAMAGAYLESRELLVLGGQVKVADLARGAVRQRGIQEVDGVDIARPVTVASKLMAQLIDQKTFVQWSQAGSVGRKGPVFLEIPLDVQGAPVDRDELDVKRPFATDNGFLTIPAETLERIMRMLREAKRPVILLGGGILRTTAAAVMDKLAVLGVPVMTTWSGFDRIPTQHPCYFGRPDTWGQRSANILMQQADLLVALGARLGLQETGFNWQQFIPVGKVVQVECDERELTKGHPRVDLPVCGDANVALEYLAASRLGDYAEWIEFCREVRGLISLNDPGNRTAGGYVSPYDFFLRISELCVSSDVMVPCSSGSANTVAMQTFQHKRGQICFNDGGLASMGYGLSGSIGAAVAAGGRRTVLVEGDGGFTQNLQELGTVREQKLNLKIFIFDDHGYASIRMTQSNYFGGRYVGCDIETGLGMPKWEPLFAAYDIPMMRIGPAFEEDAEFLARFNANGPSAFIVKIDPKQTYFPKISSRVTAAGSMESNPLHRMTPDLDTDLEAKVFRYLPPLD